MCLTTLKCNDWNCKWQSFVCWSSAVRWYPVNVADSLMFFLQRLFFFGLNSSDVSRIHISCFLFWFLVFKQQVKSLLYSLSIYHLLFNHILFRQLCVDWFVGVLDPVERMDLLRAISSYLTLVCFGRPATLFRVAMKCVQNAVTVVLGAKASAARQPMKRGCIYTPNISSLVAMSTMFVDSLWMAWMQNII